VSLPSSIKTERLLLRAYEAGDGAWYYTMSLHNREHLMRYEAENPAVSLTCIDDAESLMQDFAEEWSGGAYLFLGAFERETGTFVAQIYVGCRNVELPEYEIGYFVDVDHEGRGFVTEAVGAIIKLLFETIGALRISINCDDTNLRSARVAERCGMLREGHIRQNRRNPDGSVSGTLHYGMLREEYLQGGPVV